MFGVDCANFGVVQGFDAFIAKWCTGIYDQGPGQTCVKDEHGVLINSGFVEYFCAMCNVLITVGATAGAVFVAPSVADGCGRRMCISLGAFTTGIGAAMSAFLSFGNVSAFLTSRFITGLGVGVCCYALPIYNSEMATPKIRGRTGSLFQIFTVLGGVIAVFVMLSYHDWRFGMFMPGMFGFLVSTTIWMAPESPRWVMKKKGFEAAVAILRKVRVGDVTAEAREIEAALEAEASTQNVSMMAACGDANLRKRCMIASYLQAAQQATGVNAFLGYASILFPKIGMSNAYVSNAFFNGTMLVGCIIGVLLIDSPRGGRRIQLMASTFLMGPSLVLAGICLKVDAPGMVVMGLICLFALGFQSAWGMIPWVYPSEIFSNKERDAGMGYAVGMQYFANTVLNIVAPQMMSWSGSGTIFIFGALNITNFFFVSFFIKETKGISLEKVPALFGKVTKAQPEAVA